MSSPLELEVLTYIVKFVATFGTLFVVGIPLSAYIHARLKLRRSLVSLTFLSLVLSETIIYLTLMFTYIYPFLNQVSAIAIEIIFFTLPLFDTRTRYILRDLFKHKSPDWNFSVLEVVLVAVIGFFIISTFVYAMSSYPVLDDPLIEWMYFGKQILLSGGVPAFFGNDAGISWSGNYPPLKSFITAFLFLNTGTADPFLASLFPWLYGLAGLIAVYAIGTELDLPRIYRLISVLVAELSAVYSLQMLGWGYGDTVTAFNLVVFIYFWLRSERSTKSYFLIALLALVDAILSNYLALIFVVASVPFLIGYVREFRRVKVRTLLLALGMVCLAASWFVRNLVLVHDPVYPYMYTIFPAKGIQASIIRSIPIYKEPVQNLFIDKTYTALMNSGNQWPYLSIGVIGGCTYLIFILIEILVRRKQFSAELKKTVKLLIYSLLSFGVILGFIYFHGGFYRYLMLAIPPLSCVSGLVLFKVESALLGLKRGHWNSHQVRKWKLTFQSVSILAVILIGSSTGSYLLTNGGYHYHPAEYPSSYLNMVEYINHLPPGNLTTNDIRGFFINRTTVNFYDIPQLFTDTSNASVHMTLLEYGISYVYISLRFDYNLLKNETLLINAVHNSTYFTPLFSEGNYLIYGVNK